MSLWVPPTVSRELQDRTRAFDAEMRMGVDAGFLIEEWNRDLKQIDGCLEMIRAKPNAADPLIPGFYHVIRVNPGAPPSVIPITDENGGFTEPTSRVFDLLRSQDMWSDDVMRDQRKRKNLAKTAGDKLRAEERRMRQEEILDRWKSATETSVSMNRSVPWTQNVSGKRAA